MQLWYRESGFYTLHRY